MAEGKPFMRGMARLAFVLGLVTVVSAALAQPPRPAIKIGLVQPYTGFLAVLGPETTKGLELYVTKVGARVAGREIQILKEDTEAKPDVALTKTRKLVERDRVDALVGPMSSAEALAMRDYVHAQGVPLIVPAAFTRDLTAPGKASPSIFRIKETTDQSNFNMGTWVLKKTPYRKLVVVATDFVGGRQSADAFIAAFRAGGGEIVKEIYPPAGTADFAPFVAQMGSVPADAVWAWFSGTDAIRFIKTYDEYGLRARLPLLGSQTLVDDVILPTIGDLARGIINVGQYSVTLDTPENRAFVKDYEMKYNALPNIYSEGGYASGLLIGAAIDALKGEVGDREKFRDAIRSVAPQIRAPRGPITFDRYQQVITPVYIMKVERQGHRLVNVIVDTIPNTSQEESWKWWNK
jgi:branched-chain amino acid transport system substrate-binding protein